MRRWGMALALALAVACPQAAAGANGTETGFLILGTQASDPAAVSGRGIVFTRTSDGKLYYRLPTEQGGTVLGPLDSLAALADIGDVTITAVADDEVLAYDAASGKWINQTAAEAGLATTAHTHTGTDIVDGSIGQADLGTDSVGADEIATDAVGAPEIATGAVGAAEIGTDAVGADEIATGAVGAAEIGTDAVGADEIATDAVGSAEIAADAVGSAEIATDAVGAPEIATGAVGSAEIAAGAVGASEMAADAVGTSALVDRAVTQAKVGVGQVYDGTTGDLTFDYTDLPYTIYDGTNQYVGSIAGSTGTAAASATTYVEVTIGASPAVSTNTTSFTAGSWPLAEITADATQITGITLRNVGEIIWTADGTSAGAGITTVKEDGTTKDAAATVLDFLTYFTIGTGTPGAPTVTIKANSLGAGQLGADSVGASELAASAVDLDAVADFRPSDASTGDLIGNIAAGTFHNDNAVTTITAQTPTMTASSTNYVEIDVSAGTIAVNTTGFTAGDIPIATFVTDSTQITTVNDKRALFRAGGGGGGSSTFTGLSDTPSSYTGKAAELPRVNSGETAVEFVAPADMLDEASGIARSDVLAFLSLDDVGAGAPRIDLNDGDTIAASASGLGWGFSYRLEGDAHDNGTQGFDPSAGTALPSGVSGGGDRLVFPGNGSTNNFVDISGTPTLSATTSQTIMVGAIVDNTATPSELTRIWFTGSVNQGPNIDYASSSSRVSVGDGTQRIVNSGGVDDGNPHTIIGIWDTTNQTPYTDGSAGTGAADARTATVDYTGITSVTIGGQTTLTTRVHDGDIIWLFAYVGTSPVTGDYPEYLQNLTMADRPLIGSRYMRGKFGEGRLFLGSDYESYATSVWQDMRGEGTVSIWVQPVFDAPAASNDLSADPVLLRVDTDGTDYWELRYDTVAEDWEFEIVSGGTSAVAATQSNQTFTDGTWVHLAITWDTSNIKLYVDGSLAQSTAVPPEVGPTGELASTWRLGNRVTSNPADSVLDHVKLDNRAWTSTEVAADAAATRP